MRHGSLFTGIGGFDLAAQWMGWENVLQVEKDEKCHKVLIKRFPNAKRFRDIKEFDGKPYRGLLDIVTGGFPCKQTSVGAAIHGKRSGLNGIDSGLWYEEIRVLEEMFPDWCAVENPSGVEEWEDKIQSGLEGIGYTVSRLEFKASDFGLPHKRRRFIYVGNAHGKRLESTRQTGSPALKWIERLTIAGGDWMQYTPGDGRGIDGISRRVDRIHMICNAIVPYKAHEIFKAIEKLTA